MELIRMLNEIIHMHKIQWVSVSLDEQTKAMAYRILHIAYNILNSTFHIGKLAPNVNEPNGINIYVGLKLLFAHLRVLKVN